MKRRTLFTGVLPLLAAPAYTHAIAIHDRANAAWHRTNEAWCETGFIPASTFKIAHSLIALETGTAPDENFSLPWDGVKRSIAAWNRDLTMREAIAVSAVPYYQEIARRIGRERMQDYVDKLGYGNRDLSGPVDQFWLRGKLRITPVQQVNFLERLYDGALPVSARSMSIVRQMLITEQTSAYRIHSKTGLAGDVDLSTGWYVGWLERPAGPVFFATVVQARVGDEGLPAARAALTKERMRALGLI